MQAIILAAVLSLNATTICNEDEWLNQTKCTDCSNANASICDQLCTHHFFNSTCRHCGLATELECKTCSGFQWDNSTQMCEQTSDEDTKNISTIGLVIVAVAAFVIYSIYQRGRNAATSDEGGAAAKMMNSSTQKSTPTPPAGFQCARLYCFYCSPCGLCYSVGKCFERWVSSGRGRQHVGYESIEPKAQLLQREGSLRL